MRKRISAILLLAMLAALPARAESVDELHARIDELTAQVESMQATIDELESRLAAYEGEPESGSEYADDAEVVTFDGGSVALGDARAVYAQRTAYYEMLDIGEADYADDLKTEVLENLAEDAVLEAKAREMNLYELSDEDWAAAEADASDIYESNVQYYLSYFYEEGMTDEDVRARTEAYLAEEGVSYDDILSDCLNEIWRQRLFDAVTADVTVTEDDLRAMYDDGLEAARQNYADDPQMFEFDYTYGDVIYYRPEGYREVEYLFLPFDDEELASASGLQNEMSVTDEDGQFVLQAELDALYDGLARRHAELIGRAQAGESLASLASEYEIDDYAVMPVSAATDSMGEAFRDAAMSLEQGQISEPVRGENGLWILRYTSDIAPGDVPYEDVHDALSASALDAARQERYYELVDQWLEDAHIVYHPEML